MIAQADKHPSVSTMVVNDFYLSLPQVVKVTRVCTGPENLENHGKRLQALESP